MQSTRTATLAAASTIAVLLTAACGNSGGSAPASAGSGNSSAAAANGGGSSGGGSGTQADLCTVLTTAQIEQAIGVPVGPGKKAEDPGVGCGWIDPNFGNNSSVGLLYVDPVVYNGTKQANGQNGVTLTKVDGLGDEAYLESLAPTAKPLLFVKKGSVIVSISADVRANGSGDTDPAKDAAAEKQLGAIVASAL